MTKAFVDIVGKNNSLKTCELEALEHKVFGSGSSRVDIEVDFSAVTVKLGDNIKARKKGKSFNLVPPAQATLHFEHPLAKNKKVIIKAR